MLLKRPYLPGDGSCEIQDRLTIKREILEGFGLPGFETASLETVTDALTFMSIWMASDDELASLIACLRAEIQEPLRYLRRHTLRRAIFHVLQQAFDQRLIESPLGVELVKYGRELTAKAALETFTPLELDWSAAAKLSGVTIAEIPSCGRGMVSTRAIEPFETVVSVPSRNAITIYSAITCEGTGCDEIRLVCNGANACITPAIFFALLLSTEVPSLIISDGLSDSLNSVKAFNQDSHCLLDPQFVLILYIAFEATRVNESKFGTWLKSLPGFSALEPPTHSTNLLFADKELLAIDGDLSSSVATMRRNLRETLAWVQTTVSTNFPILYETYFKHIDMDHMLYAAWICESREFDLEIFPPAEITPIDLSLVQKMADQAFSRNCEAAHDLNIPQVSVLPGTHYLSQEASIGCKQTKFALPVCLPCDSADQQINITICTSIKTVAIIPVVDLINHDHLPQCFHPRVSDGNIILQTAVPVGCGEQVYISYGPQRSFEFLRHFGFTTKLNECDTVRFTIPIDTELKQSALELMDLASAFDLSSTCCMEDLKLLCQIPAFEGTAEEFQKFLTSMKTEAEHKYETARRLGAKMSTRFCEYFQNQILLLDVLSAAGPGGKPKSDYITT